MSASTRARVRTVAPGARPTGPLGTVLVLAGAVVGVLALLGFVVFANSATRGTASRIAAADGIVVLTGGSDRRIEEGLRLLDGGLGRRLLISGINRRTSSQELRRLAHASSVKFDCCVDLGYEAQDTIGNAEEARAWAVRHRFTSLIVVTSSYHMPRSLSELSRVLPEATLIAHPVVPRFLRDEPWWLNWSTTRKLLGEYLKLFPSAIRNVASRVQWQGDVGSALAPLQRDSSTQRAP